MQYIQTTTESFIYTVIDDVETKLQDQLVIDFDALGESIENEDSFGQFKEMIRANDVKKLDKNYIFSYGAVLFGLIPEILEQGQKKERTNEQTKADTDSQIFEALDMAYEYIDDFYELYIVLLNVFERDEKFRYHVLMKLLDVLDQNNTTLIIINNLKSIQQISKNWNISAHERIKLYVKSANILSKHNEDHDAYLTLIAAITLFEKDQKIIKEYEQVINHAITIALQHPKVVQYDILSGLPAVILQIESNPTFALYELLQIFTNGDVNDYLAWESKNKDFMATTSLNAEVCRNKITYLSIGAHASQDNIISYDKLTQIVGIKRDKIEDWIIDAIVNNIIDARLDQENECIIINSFTKRNMKDMKEWTTLQEKLTDTKAKFSKVLQWITPK